MRIAAFMLSFAITGAASAQPAKVDFRRDVVPILESRCFSCHRGNDAIASYRLDLRAELLGETTGKPLVKVGKSDESRLIHVVQGKIPNKVMPRKGPRLTDREIDVLRGWIDQGLVWDDTLFPAAVKSEHWAFQPIKPPAFPNVKNKAWIETRVDVFIAAKHAELELKPAAIADARTWIRRVTLDLTGLPPTPEETDSFVKDCQATGAQLSIPYPARKKVVDRLLASPHYGERWARHWLDVARFAESEGYESNHLRLHAWRYRDWVVDAFNRDLPFKDFVRQQLAGDEIAPYADEHLIATGFLASARLSSNEEDRLRQRNDIHVDIVNTTASAFLGLTFGCAQCHNHKFDPITARDYYRFMGLFVKGQPGNLALREPKLWAEYDAKKPKGFDESLKERDTLYALAQNRKYDEVRKGLSAAQKQALALAREERSPAQDKLARETDLLFQFTAGQFERMLTADEKKRYDAAKKAVAELEKTMLEKPQTFGFYSPVTSPHAVNVLPMKGFYALPFEPKELARAKAFLLEAGDVHKPAFVVEAGWPAFLPSPSGKGVAGEGTRLALADWLTDANNPLAARVYVNRIWQHHFGRGLVATPSDFGVKGVKPTHPELLDWLASELIRTGSTKYIHRLIVLSNTYCQASTGDAANAKRDPDNHYLWRWTPRRLEAEAIRDSQLAVSGELDRKVGGAGTTDEKSKRRSLYLFQKREAPPPQQALFDGPIAMTESCAKRQTTTVALQPLYLLNSAFSVDRAKALAARVAKSAGDDREQQIKATYQLALGRLPDAQEVALGRRFFERLASQPDTALAHYCQAILNLNELVYLE